MSVKNIKKVWEKDFKDAQKAYIGKYSLPGTLTTFDLGNPDQYLDMIEGAKKVMDQAPGVEFIKDVNSVAFWEQAATKLTKKIKSNRSIGGVKIGTYRKGRAAPPEHGVYFGIPMANLKSGGIPLNIFASTPAQGTKWVNALWNGYVADLYDTWVEHTWPASKTGQQALGTIPGYESSSNPASRQSKSTGKMQDSNIRDLFKINLKKEHSVNSTTAMMAVEAMRQSKPSVSSSVNVNYADIGQYIEDSVQADWNNKTAKKKVGNYNVNSVVSIRLGSNNPNLATDLKEIRKHAYKFIRDDVIDRFGKKISAVDFNNSVPIGKQVSDDVISEIVDGFRGRKTTKTVKKKAKKFKAAKRKTSLKKSQTTKRISKAVGLSRSALIKTAPVQKVRQKETSHLLGLKKKINKRLPAEVRRNMGGNALNNISGTFSNSAELLSLRETKAGISGEYTYKRTGGGTPPRTNQPGVYETFEGTGKYAWPAGYNPKPLIAKSIRNLARQYTEQKLVSLRRT